MVRDWSKLPRTCRTRAPWMSACANLPRAMWPSGISTAQVSPARAAKAAAEADVLPVDAHTTAFAPSSAALEMATVIPRSLKEPVGLAPSTLSRTRAPTRDESRGAGSSGVHPSSRVTTGVDDDTGRKARYSSMTPRHGPERSTGFMLARPTSCPCPRSGGVPTSCRVPDDPHDASDPFHRLEPGQPVEGGPHVPLPRLVGDEQQAGLAALTVLLQRADRDVVVAEHLGHRGQDAGAVGDIQADVALRPQFRLGQQARRLAVRGGRRGVGEPIAHRVDQVTDHRAGRRAATGALAVEHQLAGRLPF